ncbi:caveolin-1-like [Aplysia californica]|uniref:Caveolin n=1 Tax=Aplysia californica TaxID=6500 RepID=A0ABM0K603_APLCA|nr:caveolin-1-like [Aplysia californica]
MSSDDNIIDLENRDPNNLNDQVKLTFEDVIGEPDDAHSIDCVWVNSFKCFTCCKSCCYKLLTICCGIPLAIFWALEFAILTFSHVWFYTPCMRYYIISCSCVQRCYGTFMQCYIRPCYEAMGFFFNNIRVTTVTE